MLRRPRFTRGIGMKIERSGEHHQQGLPSQCRLPRIGQKVWRKGGVLGDHLTVASCSFLITWPSSSSSPPTCLSMRCCALRLTSLHMSVYPSFPQTYSNTNLQQHIRELVRQSAMHVINNGGVVRSINSWGTRTLPQKMKRHGPRQSVGE